MDYTSIDYQDFLAHHGIEGQKWGVQNGPPYPLDPEKRTNKAKEAAAKLAETGKSIVKKTKAAAAEASKKRAEDKVKADEKKAERKVKSDAKKEAKRAKEEVKEKEFKDKVIRDGDLKTLSKNKDKFTDQEIAQVIARYQLNTKVDSMAEPVEGKSRAEQLQEKANEVGKYVDTAKKYVGYAKTTLDMYNTTAEVVNSLTGKETMKQFKFEKNKNQNQDDGKRITRMFDENGFKYKETTQYKQGNDTYTDTRTFTNEAKNTSSSSKPETNTEVSNLLRIGGSQAAKDFADEFYNEAVNSFLNSAAESEFEKRLKNK